MHQLVQPPYVCNALFKSNDGYNDGMHAHAPVDRELAVEHQGQAGAGRGVGVGPCILVQELDGGLQHFVHGPPNVPSFELVAEATVHNAVLVDAAAVLTCVCVYVCICVCVCVCVCTRVNRVCVCGCVSYVCSP